MSLKNSKSFGFLLLLVLASCGYRWEPEYPNQSRPSVSIPFAIGDEDGTFTAEIARALTQSGLADLQNREGDYRLQVAILNTVQETVGYRRDRQIIKGESKKNLLASEGRKNITVEAILFKADTNEIAYGPYVITADADYDYVDGDSLNDLAFFGPGGEQIVVLPFSLGQLESFEAAQEAASRPLYVRAAQKIVDVIFSEW